MAIPIPQFQSRVRQQANYNPGALSAEQAGAGIGRALSGLGATIGQIAERMGEEFRRQEKFDALIKEDQFLQGMQERETAAQQEADPTGKGYTQGFMTQFGQEGEKYIQTLPPRLQQEFRQRLSGFTRTYAGRSAAFETAARNGYESNAIARDRDAILPGIQADPDSYDAQFQKYQERINSSGLDARRKYELLEDFKERSFNARRQGLIDKGRDKEAEELSRQRAEERARQPPAPAVAPARPGTAPGYTAPRAEVENYIVQAAQQRGIDPKTALTVYRHEGAGAWQSAVVKDGKRETSYGPFQLYTGGGLGNKFQRETGLDPRDPNTWRENIDFALNEARKGGWGPWYGAKAAGITGFSGIGRLPQTAQAAPAQAGGGTATDASSQRRMPVSPGRPSGPPAAAAPPPEADVPPEVSVTRALIAKRDEKWTREAEREIADYSSYVRNGNDRDPAREAEIVSRYGPNVGPKVQDTFDKNADYGAKVKSIATATPEEVDAISREYQERLKSPEDYRANLQEFNTIQKIITDRTKALVTDPAGYIVQHSPDVRQSAMAMDAAARAAPGQVPGLSQDYAAATLAEQARLGVPPELQRILTPDMVSGISRQFAEAKDPAALMQQLQTQWGSLWPKVHGEIAKELPGSAVVIGTMNRPDQVHAAARLGELAKVPLAEMEKAYKDEQLKGRDGLQQAVLEQMRGFRSTLVNNPGAEITFNQFQEAIYRLGMDNLGQGDEVQRAASRAYQDVLGKRFNFVGTARIPTEYESGKIMTGANRALTQLLPQSDVDLPFGSPYMKPGDTKEQYIRSLQTGGGFWVTSPDQTGLVLYQSPSRKAVTIDGRPFTVSWQKLLDMSAGDTGDEPATGDDIFFRPQVAPTGPRTPPPPEGPPMPPPPQGPPPAQGLTMPGGIP